MTLRMFISHDLSSRLRTNHFKGMIFPMPFWMIVCVLSLAFTAGRSSAVAPSEPLTWESTGQNYTVKKGEVTAHFTFKVANTSGSEVVIDDLKASCGCTVAKMPAKPWRIAPGQHSQMDVLVDLRGKYGLLLKEISVVSATAPKVLTIMVNIPEGTTKGMSSAEADRIWGDELAATDHQAVFKKDCARCHLAPAFGKYGQALYVTACGICHEARHRATMVPDLHALKTEITPDYWQNWVTHGKAGTLMPGFSAKEGGPLDNSQIKSLVEYLTKNFPRPMKQSASAATGKK